ncbi:unnamed protein product [Ectocarpus sp. CCAP 1310/34]|nr:unnamed protein product [Ectocarpus sp. CCAP 1310/34]
MSHVYDQSHFRFTGPPLEVWSAAEINAGRCRKMSSIYLTEPATHGKVLLHTSFGDIDVELWAKECPKACRNFVQLAMEGYYDNTIFHRIIRKFMVQGGDPTGTGKGGESVYGKPFRDEIHTRIKFNHRGQVAMANENEPRTNHSQFFFTLDSAAHLDKKHTIFGKITGNTIFNALRMGDIDTDKDDRPLEPPRLISVEVLLNPFDDIVPRDLSGRGGEAAAAAAAATAAEAEAKKKRRKKQGKKDFKLLSFGEEADQEEKELDALVAGGGGGGGSKSAGRGIKSAHDALDDEKLSKDAAYDEKLSKDAAYDDKLSKLKDGLRKAVKSAAVAGKGAREDAGSSNGAGGGGGGGGAGHPEPLDDGDAFMQKMRQKMMDKRKALEKSKDGGDNDDNPLDFEPEEEEEEEEKKEAEGSGATGAGWRGGDADDETDKEKARRKAIKQRAKEYESLREEMKAKHRAARVMTGEERAKYDAEHMHQEMISPVEQMRAKYKKRRKEAGTREDSTMAKLAAFTSTMRTSKKRAKTEDKAEEKKVEAYHGQVTEGKLYEGEDDADDGENWFTGPLKFKRHIDDDLRKGSDGRRADDYAVIDPLKQQQPKGGRGNDAHGGRGGGESRRDGGASRRDEAGARNGMDRKREDKGGRHKSSRDSQLSDRRR